MELMQLEMFVAVVEEGSVHKAAKRVCRTQPAVSLAIRKLEDGIGASLFDRTQRQGYSLTQAGEALYGYASRILNLRSEARVVIDDIKNARSGRLRVGASESVSFYLFPRLATSFHAQYPNVQIEMKCDSSVRLLKDLKERRLDFALLYVEPSDSEIESRIVMRDKLVLIVSPNHRLACRGRVKISDLGQESIIAEGSSSVWHAKVVEAFEQAQTPLNIVVENAPIETIKRMAGLGLGIGFVPMMCVRDDVLRGELAIVEVEGLDYERTLWAARRRRVSPCHSEKAFLQIVTSYTEFLNVERDSRVTRVVKSPVPAKRKEPVFVKKP